MDRSMFDTIWENEVEPNPPAGPLDTVSVFAPFTHAAFGSVALMVSSSTMR